MTYFRHDLKQYLLSVLFTVIFSFRLKRMKGTARGKTPSAEWVASFKFLKKATVTGRNRYVKEVERVLLQERRLVTSSGPE